MHHHVFSVSRLSFRIRFSHILGLYPFLLRLCICISSGYGSCWKSTTLVQMSNLSKAFFDLAMSSMHLNPASKSAIWLLTTTPSKETILQCSSIPQLVKAFSHGFIIILLKTTDSFEGVQLALQYVCSEYIYKD